MKQIWRLDRVDRKMIYSSTAVNIIAYVRVPEAKDAMFVLFVVDCEISHGRKSECVHNFLLLIHYSITYFLEANNI